MTILELNIPTWALPHSCIKDTVLTLKPTNDGGLLVLGCICENECYTCNPHFKLPIDTRKLEEVESFDSENKELTLSPEGVIVMTDSFVAKKLKKYSKLKDQYYFWSGLSCDLHTIRIYKIKTQKEKK